MNRDQIMALTIEGVEARRAELRTAITQEGADLAAIDAEVTLLEERAAQLRTEAERRSALLNRIAQGEGNTIRSLNGMDAGRGAQRTYDASSPEYRQAYLLNISGRGEQMTEEQRTAFVHTTANTTAPLPTEMLNRIWDLVSKAHVIMGDINIIRSGCTIEVLKHTAIAAGDAAVVSENAANDDEQNTFVKVTLAGKDFSKSIDLSYAMQRMAIPALEDYLVGEISRQIGEAMADDVVTNAIAAKIASGNKINTAGVKKLEYTDVTGAFALLKRCGEVCVYGSRSTIYTYLVGMVDANKRPIFQVNAQDGAEGVLLGGKVKIEESVPANVLLIGDPKRVVYNLVEDILLESDKDIKKHVVTHSGYARGEGELIDTESFVQLTVKQA